MTERKRCQKLAKCCSVSLQNWMNQWNCSEVNVRLQAQVLGKNLPIIVSEMWYVSDFSVVRTGDKLVHFNSRSCNGEIVQLQSALNDDYNNFSGKIRHVPDFRDCEVAAILWSKKLFSGHQLCTGCNKNSLRIAPEKFPCTSGVAHRSVRTGWPYYKGWFSLATESESAS